MIIPLLISLGVAWLSFMGVAGSLLVGNAAGMFWYGITLIISGVATRVFFDQMTK